MRWIQAFLGTYLLLFATGHGSIENTDATATMHAARALWLRGDSGLRCSHQAPDWPGEAFLADYIVQRRAGEGVLFYGKQGKNGLVYVWFPMGHVWLMVPAVALGEAIAGIFPGVEDAFREKVAPGLDDAVLLSNNSYRDGHFVIDQAVVALLPPLFGTVSILLLFLIALALGATRRDALWSTVAIAVGTQFFPLARENLSDGPGMCFLLAALLATVRAWRGQASALGLALGGFLAGFAVLSRYPHGTLVPLLGLAVAIAAYRRRRLRELLWFALGGLPCLVMLLAINYARHGDVADTGYPKASSWFNYPIWFGAFKILFAAGKGILWFTPLLWLVVPLALRRPRPQLSWLGWSLFAVPMLMFSSTNGWQSGQCWGVRYVTPGIVCLLAILLPQLRPWSSHRRVFLALFAVGVLVNLTGVVSPTRGHSQLAGQAVLAMYQRQYEAGEIDDEDWESVRQDAADHFYFLPRFSPLHGHWTYLYRSVTGGFEDQEGRVRNGSANTIEPLFGVVALDQSQSYAPGYWEDRGGRHLWWRFWGDLLGISSWLLLAPVLLAGAVLAWSGWRRLSQ